MKNKLLLILLLVLVYSMTIEAQQKKQKTTVPPTWAGAVASAKKSLLDALDKDKMTMSQIVKSQNNASTLSADISGKDQLVLSTSRLVDSKWPEYGIWANARLIANDGSIVQIGDLKDSYSPDGIGRLQYNTNSRNQPVHINKSKYDQTIMVQGNSQIIIPLNKKYKKFEAEIGIEDLSNKEASLLFRVQSITGKPEADNIIAAYPLQSSFVAPSIGNDFRNMLTANNAVLEKKAAYDIVRLLKNPSYFQNQLKSVDSDTDLQRKLVGYLNIIDKAIVVYNLQESLAWLNVGNVEAAFNNMSKSPKFNVQEKKAKLEELKSLSAKGFNGIYTDDQSALASAQKALDLKREILLSNPLLDMDKILVGRYKIGTQARGVGAPSLGTQPNNWSNQTSANQSGFDAEIAELSNLRGTQSSRTIFKPKHTSSVPDLHLHWNADKFMFTMAEPDDHHWQVYEIGVDGQNFKQVTDQKGDDLDFFDACYLPNGKIMASSNVGGQGVPCVSGSDQVGNLCLLDPAKNKMRRLTFDQDANWGPVVMNNGRVMFVRWEYTDLTHYFSRMVMHMNPDGTEQRALYGSGSVFPTSVYDVQPLPNHPTRFIGIISGHHGVARSGRLIIFDPAKSRKEEKGMVQELPFGKRPIIPIIKDQMVDDVWPQFLKPQPLSNDYFLVTAKLSPKGLWGIYLVDIYDNLTLLAEYEGEGLVYGIPLVKRPVPPVIPEKVQENSKEATVFIQDLYEGEGLPGVPRGTVKELRVFAYEYAYIRAPSNHTAQGIQSGWDLKRLLGTVPVEQDGSVMFKIPANTPISLQPLDSEGRSIQWMRSWLTGMPGETVSCVGCHEDQNQIPKPKRAMASTKKPQTMKLPEGGVRSFTFDLEVQPILDRNCIACHNADKSEMDLTGGRKTKDGFGESYLKIHPYVHRQGPEAGMKVLYPYEYHASVSPLIQMLKRGHYGVNLTDEEWRKIYNWIDFNAPDKGTFLTIDERYNYDQYDRRIRLTDRFANGMSVHWKEEIKNYADHLAAQQKQEPAKVNFVETKFKDVKLKGFPFDGKSLVGSNQERKVVEIAPGVSITLVKIPAGKYIMGKNVQNSDVGPVHIVEIKKPFWMSEKEITNEQFGVFYPSHDSRFVDQQWKDHVNEGYPANKPQQPVIRVSYNDVMDFCKQMSTKSGFNISIPTEEQWEWACRAGSDTDFWYGTLETDFSKFENMSDVQMNKMAVSGVDPQPMSPNSYWFKYFSYHLKNANVDDGNMIMATPGSYQANPFGLYDMHGNVSEWTKSDYLPYQQTNKKKENESSSELKVVRGGSWKDHPKFSTAHYRQAYYPFQKVHNVGFRIIMED